MPILSIDGLTPAQVQVANALASGLSISNAAATLGIGRSTIYTWLNTNPAFSALVQSAAEDSARVLRDKLHDCSIEALDTVARLMRDPEASPAVRLRAALAILNRPNADWVSPVPIGVGTAQNETVPDTSEQPTQNSEIVPPTSREIPRNSPCPCGSRLKFKRCCGRAAPPVLSRAA